MGLVQGLAEAEVGGGDGREAAAGRQLNEAPPGQPADGRGHGEGKGGRMRTGRWEPVDEEDAVAVGPGSTCSGRQKDAAVAIDKPPAAPGDQRSS
jgi:hypothetical protein